MASESDFDIEWVDGKREPKCAPDPRYPNGIDVFIANSEPYCIVQVPYPAKRCGFYSLRCRRCNFTVALTTAGRPDDPRSVRVPCQLTGKVN